MATETTNYHFSKPAETDYYDVNVQNNNWDVADQALKGLGDEKVDKNGGDIANTEVSEFAASSTEWPVPAAGEAPKTLWGKTKKFFEDFKNWMTGVCLLGQLVSNNTTNNANLPASAAAVYQEAQLRAQQFAQLNSDKAPISHIHDDRYYTESEINSKLSGLLLTETIVISPTMSSVTCGGTYSLAKNGYTPIAITGWEIRANTAVFVQRCEINNQILNYNLRTTSNTPFSGQVYFDVTILYKKN